MPTKCLQINLLQAHPTQRARWSNAQMVELLKQEKDNIRSVKASQDQVKVVKKARKEKGARLAAWGDTAELANRLWSK